MGNVLYEMGKFEAAAVNYKKAIELNEQYSDAYNGLGNTFITLQRREEAIKAYKSAIESDPSNSLPFFNLVEVVNTDEEMEDGLSFL